MRSSASVSAATAGRWAATASGTLAGPQVDPVVQLEPRLAAQVLDRPGQLAGVALGAQLGRQPGVEDHDQPIAVRDGRAGPGRRLDLDLVRRQRHAAERHRSVVLERDLAGPGGRHHRGDRRPEPLPDLGQERLDPALDEGRTRRR